MEIQRDQRVEAMQLTLCGRSSYQASQAPSLYCLTLDSSAQRWRRGLSGALADVHLLHSGFPARSRCPCEIDIRGH